MCSFIALQTMISSVSSGASWTESAYSPEERSMVLTFPTREFYVHAPTHRWRRTEIEHQTPGRLLNPIKSADPKKDELEVARFTLKNLAINKRLVARGCEISAAQSERNGPFVITGIACSGKGMFFEIEGVKFAAYYSKPEFIRFDPNIEYGETSAPLPTIYIEDYLTTAEITLVEPYTTKSGAVIKKGSRLECRPDQLDPNGVVKCSYVGWHPNDVRPYFGDTRPPDKN